MIRLVAVLVAASLLGPGSAPEPGGMAGQGRTPVRGLASWVDASYGTAYMASRSPVGTWLRVVGPLGAVTRMTTDYGPSKRLHPDRIVDLSRRDFGRICGDPERLGTCPVRVVVLGGVVPPETSTDG